MDTTPVPEIDVKTKIAETKQHGRVGTLTVLQLFIIHGYELFKNSNFWFEKRLPSRL